MGDLNQLFQKDDFTLEVKSSTKNRKMQFSINFHL
jgi:hypothetical protein